MCVCSCMVFFLRRTFHRLQLCAVAVLVEGGKNRWFTLNRTSNGRGACVRDVTRTRARAVVRMQECTISGREVPALLHEASSTPCS